MATRQPGKWDRSTSYRKDFFATNKGLLGGWLYFCAYCGKPLTRKKVQVDHHMLLTMCVKIHCLSYILVWVILFRIH